MLLHAQAALEEAQSNATQARRAQEGSCASVAGLVCRDAHIYVLTELEAQLGRESGARARVAAALEQSRARESTLHRILIGGNTISGAGGASVSSVSAAFGSPGAGLSTSIGSTASVSFSGGTPRTPARSMARRMLDPSDDEDLGSPAEHRILPFLWVPIHSKPNRRIVGGLF